MRPIRSAVYIFGANELVAPYIFDFAELGFLSGDPIMLYKKLKQNKSLCSEYKWEEHFDSDNPVNANNIILYFVGNYDGSEIVSAAANISIKNEAYIDPFDDDPVEQYIKELYINYFCGTPGLSAAALLMLKIIDIMKVLKLDKIIIDVPLTDATPFYANFGFKKQRNLSKLTLSRGGKRRLTKRKKTHRFIRLQKDLKL